MRDANGLADAAARCATELARVLALPVAILSRDADSWHFEADAWPRGESAKPLRPAVDAVDGPSPAIDWTGALVGRYRGRDWLLMLPGQAERWRGVPELEGFVSDIGETFRAVAEREDARYVRLLHRRLYALGRRLTTEEGMSRIGELVLRTICAQTGARVAALATWSAADEALGITATVGYAVSIVEHLRVRSGEGILGEVHATRRPLLVSRCSVEGVRRLRYATDSFMVLPVLVGRRCAAVIALTDRADGRPFDARDFDAARLLAGQAAAGFARERISDDLSELTRMATVDPLTGLFNRRYLEGRLDAEVQRALRQQRPLALLMIDVDDFKRLNDTWGHMEGDRALKDVADLLRSSVRIFDVCARFGGEEFVIVMPGTTADVAAQVAERIRRRVQHAPLGVPLPVTISVGIGTMEGLSTADDLIQSADRALMAAKMGGKNAVWIEAVGAYPRQRPYRSISESRDVVQPSDVPPEKSSAP